MTDPRADLEARVNAGEWLRPTEVATLFDAGRSTIHGWIQRGVLTVRRHPVNKYRTVNPEDVQRLLAEMREEPEG